MVKRFSILAMCLFIAGCLTTAESPHNQLAVIETWSGYAFGHGSDCSDAEVKVNLLEDNSIVGRAHSIEYNLVIQLKGKLSPTGDFKASGSGIGGVSVTYKGIVNGDSATGTWDTDRPGCRGTWELAKISS